MRSSHADFCCCFIMVEESAVIGQSFVNFFCQLVSLKIIIIIIIRIEHGCDCCCNPPIYLTLAAISDVYINHPMFYILETGSVSRRIIFQVR